MGRHKKYDTTYYSRNKEKCKASSKQWRLDNRECYKLLYKNWRHSPLGRYSKYRQNAKARGLIVTISEEEFNKITSKECIYCGCSDRQRGIDRSR